MQETAAAILAPPKGMLVADEYAEALVAGAGDDAAVQKFAKMVVRTRDLGSYVSAVLLTPGTFEAVAPRLPESQATPLLGVRLAPGSDLRPELADRASFVEWRANLSPREVPRGAAHIEAAALATGAAAAQAAGLLPVLTVAMPDIGSSSIAVNQAVTTNALLYLRQELDRAGVDARHLLLRINMVIPGQSHPVAVDPGQVARLTVQVMERCVPSETPGVLLLSGGQSLDRACANLHAVTALAAERAVPWRVTFGFSRPLVSAAAGAGDEDEARRLLVHSARCASESLATAPVPGEVAS